MLRVLFYTPSIVLAFMTSCNDGCITSPQDGSLLCDTLIQTNIGLTGKLIITQQSDPYHAIIAHWNSQSNQLVRKDTLCHYPSLNYPHGHPDLEVLEIRDTAYLYFTSAIEMGTSEARTVTFCLYRLNDGKIFSLEYEEAPISIVFTRQLRTNPALTTRPDLLEILNERSKSAVQALAPDSLELIYSEFLNSNYSALLPLWFGIKAPKTLTWFPTSFDLVQNSQSSIACRMDQHARYTIQSLHKGPVIALDMNTGLQWVIWAPRNKLDWIAELSLHGDTLVLGSSQPIYCDLVKQIYWRDTDN